MPRFHVQPICKRQGVISGFVLREQYTTRTDVLYVDGFGPDGEPVATEVSVDTVVPSLVPLLSRGVAFAQSTMWRPASSPVVPAAAANQQSWLWWNHTTGLYWTNTYTPTVTDDAFIGWVRADGTGIIATSTRVIGDGDEATVPVPSGPVAGAGPDYTPGPAPNVTADNPTVVYDWAGSTPVVRVGSRILLPVADANYPHLYTIRVALLDGATLVGTVRTLSAPWAPDGTNHITWVGENVQQSTQAKTYTMRFDVFNESGELTAGGYTLNVNVNAAVTGSGPGQAVTPTAISGTDVGPHRIDGQQLTYSKIRASWTTSANAGNQVATLWLSKDNGVTFTWIGWYPYSGTAGSADFTDGYVALIPAAVANWKWAVALGAIGGVGGVLIAAAALPATALVSAAFSVSGLAAPPAAQLSGLTVIGPTYAGINGIGNPFWTMRITGSISSSLDPDTWTFEVTVKGVDASGTADPGPSPNADEREWFEFVNRPGTFSSPILLGNYNAPGSAYEYLDVEIYAINRANPRATEGWRDASAVLQQWPGGLTYKRVHFGPNPGGTLRLDQADPTTLGPGLQVDPVTGEPQSFNPDPLASLAGDWSFEYSTTASLAAGYSAWNATNPGVAGYGSEIRTDGGNSGAKYVRLNGNGTSNTGQIQQLLRSVPPSLPVYVQVAARSSNHSTNHTLTVTVEWYRADGSSISTSTVGSLSGYVASWTNRAISGYVQAPVGTSSARVTIARNLVDPGYWDIDDVLVQPVVSQAANGQAVTTLPDGTLLAGDYSALVNKSTSDASYSYLGRKILKFAQANGDEFTLSAASGSGLEMTLYSPAAAGRSIHLSTITPEIMFFDLGTGLVTGFTAGQYYSAGSLGVTQVINFPKTSGTITVKGGIIVGVT